MTDPKETPYQLTWTTKQYRSLGPALGFSFEETDFHHAVANERHLGTRRYMPSRSAEIELPFPPGVLVRCRLELTEPVMKHFTPGKNSDARPRYLPDLAGPDRVEGYSPEALLTA